MRDVVATIKAIENKDRVHKVVFDMCDTTISMFSLELPSSLRVGSCVKLSAHPTAIAIAKDLLDTTQVSYENQLRATITAIDKGELLTILKLDICGYSVESIISTTAFESMQLRVQDTVIALIKASQLAISEVCDV
jgi:molybdopterin-binding protein